MGWGGADKYFSIACGLGPKDGTGGGDREIENKASFGTNGKQVGTGMDGPGEYIPVRDIALGWDIDIYGCILYWGGGRRSGQGFQSGNHKKRGSKAASAGIMTLKKIVLFFLFFFITGPIRCAESLLDFRMTGTKRVPDVRCSHQRFSPRGLVHSPRTGSGIRLVVFSVFFWGFSCRGDRGSSSIKNRGRRGDEHGGIGELSKPGTSRAHRDHRLGTGQCQPYGRADE